MPVIASFLHGQSVELGTVSVASRCDDPEDDLNEFLRLVHLRHAISCASALESVLPAIERQLSTSSQLIRKESRGTLRGRLDVPRYLARKARCHSWPRRYPVLVNNSVLDTPENALVRSSLAQVRQALTFGAELAHSAERASALRAYRWTYRKESVYPWGDVHSDADLARLRIDSENRVLRRQTGNEAAYSEFLKWLDEWQASPRAGNNTRHRHIAAAQLAFPQEQFFWERVFEIWCLTKVVSALEAAGCSVLVGPRALFERGKLPIYELTFGGKEIAVWFQRALSSADARWRYIHSYNSLRGIPDIIVTRSQGTPLIVDAKYRLAASKTRSEETYKMLGYLENFRNRLQSRGFFGVLIFLSENLLSTDVESVSGGSRIGLCAAHPTMAAACTLHTRLREIMQQWLTS